MTNTIATIILAAGDGKRMQSTTPKMMSILHGRPLIDYVVSAVESADVSPKPVVVVSPKHTLVQDFLGDRATYVVQPEQLGTGHAVGVAESVLQETCRTVVVLYGDMPFLQPESIKRLVIAHEAAQNTITMMTVPVPNFDGTHKPLYAFGRIIRDSSGNILRSVELKDTTDEEKKITEVNPCYYCFHADWLWPHLKKLENQNAQKEYYLTDLIKMAIDEGEKISSISIDPHEAIGINTKEDLEQAHQSNLFKSS